MQPMAMSAPNDKTLNNKLRGHLAEVVLSFRREVQTERTAQLLRLQMYNRLWKGEHSTVPMINNNVLRYVPLYETSGGRGKNYPPQHRLNYYKGDGAKLIGALSITPGMKAQCDDKDDQNAQSRKRIAQEIVTRLYRQWSLEFVMPSIIQAMYERGNIFIHTPYVVDGNRFGIRTLPNLVPGKVPIAPEHYACPACLGKTPVEVAQQTGRCMDPQCGQVLDQSDYRPVEEIDAAIQDPQNPYKNLPKGSVDFRLYDSRTTFTSFQTTKWDDTKWLCHEQEQYKGALISAYPWLQDEMAERRYMGGGNDDTDDAYAFMTRQQASSQNTYDYLATSDRRYWWKHTCWYMAPEMYYQLDDRDVRNYLLSSFPSGAKVVFINNLFGTIQPAMLQKEWVGCSPEAGAGFYTKPLGEEHANNSNLINTMVGIMVSTAQKGSPLMLYDADLFDIDQLRDKPTGVLEFIKTIPQGGKSIRDMIHQTTPAQVNQHVPQVMDMFITGTRENGNINPPMWGAGPPEQTLGATSLKRDQSMQPHMPTYGNVRQMLGRAMDNGVYQVVSHATPDGEVYFSPRPGEQETYRHMELKTVLQGGWYTYVDDRIPMNWGQKEAKTWQLLGLPPEVAMPILGFDRPNNITTIQEAIGFKDLKANRMDAYNKVVRMIALLSKQEPIMPEQQDMMMVPPGMPPPQPMPSIPVDEFEDDHLFCAEVVKEWAQSEAAFELKNDPVKGNPAGYMNVILWAQQHLMIANMAMMQQPQVGPDGKPVEPPPGGGPAPGPGSGAPPPQTGGPGSNNMPLLGAPQPTPMPGMGVPSVGINPPPQETQGIL